VRYRWGNPARSAYAVHQAAAVAAQFPFVSLFNDGSAQYLLAIIDIGNDPAASSPAGYVISQGQIGSNPRQGLPVVTGRTTVQGVVTQGNAATLPSINLFPFNTGSSGAWPHEFPLIVLSPGWALTQYGNTVNQPATVSFWWEIAFAVDVINPDIGLTEHTHHERY
jgi:hypothetical protein